MATELMQIDDLLIDKFNPYAIPGEDTFSPGITHMGGYKGPSTLDWYKPVEDTPFKDESPACGMPSVGDYTVDFCTKKPMVRNNQPGWAMEFDGIDPLITSSYGLVTAKDATKPSHNGFMYKTFHVPISDNSFFVLLALLALMFLLFRDN